MRVDFTQRHRKLRMHQERKDASTVNTMRSCMQTMIQSSRSFQKSSMFDSDIQADFQPSIPLLIGVPVSNQRLPLTFFIFIKSKKRMSSIQNLSSSRRKK